MRIKLSSREWVILYATIAVAVGTALFHFVLAPLAHTVGGVNKEIELKTALLKRHSRLVGKGKSILSLYDRYKEALKMKNSAEEVETDLYKEIKSLADAAKLSIERIRPQPVVNRVQYKEVLLEVELSGSLDSFFTFITKAEDSTTFIRITSLRISSQTAHNDTLRCKLVLSKLFF